MSSIVNIQAREIIDSRGNPTIEVEAMSSSGVMARVAVPSGASTGKNEALELRDNDPKRYNGKGVLKAIANINDKIAPMLLDNYVLNQKNIDHKLIALDGTKNKSNLGANAILGVSLACAKLGARHLGIPLYRYLSGPFFDTLPMPMANIINGGAHSNNSLDIQEFMIIPKKAQTMREAVQMISEVFHSLKGLLNQKGYSTSVGDEGGFAPELKSNEEAIEIILEAVEKSNISSDSIAIALDVAASELVNHSSDKKKYCLWKSTKKEYSSLEMIDFWENFIGKYPQIVSIEDPMAEDDWEGWENFTATFAQSKRKLQIVGDDIFVTNKEFLLKGIENKVGNAILIKLNQIGTLTETLEVIATARSNGYKTIISHRSGETEDTFIADLSIGSEAGQIKTGSICRSERVAKYNQLLRIEEELTDLSSYTQKPKFREIF